MMRYSVTATLDTKETLSKYCEWLENEHIPAVMSGGALTSELSIVDNENDFQVNTLYTFSNSEVINHYLTEIAPNLSSLQTCVTKFYSTGKVLNFKRFVATTGFSYQSTNAKNPLTIQPGMIRYNVIATLASSNSLDEYLSWLAGGHIQAVVHAGGLSGEYNVLKNDDPNETNVYVASVYLFPTLEALHGYQNGIAVTLREEGVKLFVETKKVIKFDRYIGTIVSVINENETSNKPLSPVDISPYLMFDGQCREAMTFYRQCLQGDLQLMDADTTLSNSKILHGTLLTNRSFTPPTPYASTIMSSDNIGYTDSNSHSFGNSISVSINFYSFQQIQSISSSLAHNGTVSIPLSRQMWGAYFADVTDQFSINWYLNMMIPADYSNETTVELNKPFEITPYLRFEAQCEEAMREYQRILGGDLQLMEFPNGEDSSENDKDLEGTETKRRKRGIMHSSLTFQPGLCLMACDNPCPETPIQRGNNVFVSLSFGDALAIRSCYRALSEGGKILHPLGQPFWGGLFGQFVDKFGIQWMVSYHPKEERVARAVPP